MSTWDSERLLQRMREVIEGASVTLRGIPAGTYGTDLPDGMSTNEEARRAVRSSSTVQVQMEPSITRVSRSPASPPTIGNMALYDIECTVRVVAIYTAPVAVLVVARDSIRAAVVSASDVLAQAFGYPGNMTQTAGGNATGLVSGLLAKSGDTEITVRAALDGGGGVVEGINRFKGVVRVTPATS